MAEVKRIGVWSLAKLEALLMAIFGLILGIVTTIFGALVSGPFGATGTATFGALSIIILPIGYGVFGFIGGAIGAFIYNLVAGWIGGVEIELN